MDLGAEVLIALFLNHWSFISILNLQYWVDAFLSDEDPTMFQENNKLQNKVAVIE